MKVKKKNDFYIYAYCSNIQYENQIWDNVKFIPRLGDKILFVTKNNACSRSFTVNEITWSQCGEKCIIYCN